MFMADQPPAGILAKPIKNSKIPSSELHTIAGPTRGQSPSPELAFWTIGPESHSNYYLVAPGLHSIVERPVGDTGLLRIGSRRP
jgi:hypothetical protein